MYHYIRSSDENNLKYLNFLDIKEFQKQLDYFDNNFSFVTEKEFKNFVNGKLNMDSSKVLLTFDDGIKDHYKYVFPILKERNIFGIFFIPSYQLFNNKLLDVHRIHFLRGFYGSEDLWNKIKRHISDKDMRILLNEKKNKNLYNNQILTENDWMLKTFLNYIVSEEDKKILLDELMLSFNEEEIHKHYYMTLHEIKEISKNGFWIGGHSNTHKILANLKYLDQYEEIEKSLLIVKMFTKKSNPIGFSYPYGLDKTYNEDTIEILKNNNVKYAFVFDNNLGEEDVSDKFRLSRVDCNQY
jgi:peptidoglycan/xylan/chitin deacetylase (PgdA/CDA1 family)